MPTPIQDNLFQLIKTLTKAEKRNFRLYVTRNQSSEDLKFIHLFDVLDKSKDYEESIIFKKVPDIRKEQLSNLKAHLYKQLLTSLRLLHKSRSEVSNCLYKCAFRLDSCSFRISGTFLKIAASSYSFDLSRMSKRCKNFKSSLD